MGVTIIHKSSFSQRKRKPKISLVFSGGAVSGGAFKLGGLIALNNFIVNRKVTDFDTYFGISAGAILAAPVAAGISPEELLKGMYGSSKKIDPITPLDFYYPNWKELMFKPFRLLTDVLNLGPGATVSAIGYVRDNWDEMKALMSEFLSSPSYVTGKSVLTPVVSHVIASSELPAAWNYLASGIFDNKRLERYVRRALVRNRLPNNFKLLKYLRGSELYILATKLNTAEPVVFGHDEDNSLSISEAVQASSALPVWYKPARINEVDYIDAAIIKTANISFSVKRRADLIIAYNPFRPFVQEGDPAVNSDLENLADMGVVTILNQAFRMMLHSRLRLSLRAIAQDPEFHGDIILFEPIERDRNFFSTNPLAFWKFLPSAEHGFSSVRDSIARHYDRLRPILHHHGLECDLSGLEKNLDIMRKADDEETILDVLGKEQVPRKPFVRLVR